MVRVADLRHHAHMQDPSMTTGVDPSASAPRRLRRRTEGKVIGGVCGGVADYLGVDPVVVRLVWVVAAFTTGIGFLAYLVAMFLLPAERSDGTLEHGCPTTAVFGPKRHGDSEAGRIAGVVLMIIAGSLVFGHWWWSNDVLVPLLLIGGGAYLLLRGRRSSARPVVHSWPHERFHPTSADHRPAAPAAPDPYGDGLIDPTLFDPIVVPGFPDATFDPAPGARDPLRPPEPTSVPPDGITYGPAPEGGAESGRGVDPAIAWLLDSIDDPLGPDPWDTEEPHPSSVIVQRAAHRRGHGSQVTVALLILGAGVVGFLDAAGAVEARAEWVLPAALGVVGVGLFVSSLFSSARGLIGLGLFLVGASSLAVAVDLPVGGGVGDRVYTPTAASDIPARYRLGVGDLHVDLTQLELSAPTGPKTTELPDATTATTTATPPDPVVVRAEVGVGELTVVVPDGVTIKGNASVDGGDLTISLSPTEQNTDGFDVDQPLSRSAGPGAPVIVLDLHVGLGHIEVLDA